MSLPLLRRWKALGMALAIAVTGIGLILNGAPETHKGAQQQVIVLVPTADL